jgi:hypothetical protein
MRRLHVQRGCGNRSRRENRSRPRAELVNAGQRVDRWWSSQPGIGMPQDRLQVPPDHIGQIADRVVLRLGVVREVRDREAEPAPVTDVVPEEGIISGHGMNSVQDVEEWRNGQWRTVYGSVVAGHLARRGTGSSVPAVDSSVPDRSRILSSHLSGSPGECFGMGIPLIGGKACFRDDGLWQRC